MPVPHLAASAFTCLSSLQGFVVALALFALAEIVLVLRLQQRQAMIRLSVCVAPKYDCEGWVCAALPATRTPSQDGTEAAPAPRDAKLKLSRDAAADHHHSIRQYFVLWEVCLA